MCKHASESINYEATKIQRDTKISRPDLPSVSNAGRSQPVARPKHTNKVSATSDHETRVSTDPGEEEESI
jgi:hypothetical protein